MRLYIRIFSIFFITISVVVLAGCSNDLQKPAERRIIQSVKIHDDNVNGIYARTHGNQIAEITNFFYNNNNLLDSFNIMSDSTPSAHLIKSMKLTYFPTFIRAKVFDDSTGIFHVDFHFNSSNQLTSIEDTIGLGFGTFINYTNNKITKITTRLDSTSTSTNFVYDGSDNLIQFVVSDFRNRPFVRVSYEYDYNRYIPQYLDIRFASAGIKYIYSGGVNVISLMGLNFGAGNSHRIFKRIEYDLQTGQNGNNYIFEYGTNNNNEITNRKITVNDTIEVFFQYRY